MLRDLTHIRSFLAIADCGSVSGAADVLRVAQPALSRQLRLLEASVGHSLFERGPGGMTLTEAGLRLRERMGGLVAQLDKAVDDVRSFGAEPQGEVTLGLVPTVGAELTPRLLGRVTEQLPLVSLRLIEGYTAHIVDWIHRGEVDLGVIYAPQTGLHLHLEPLMPDDLLLVGPAPALAGLPDPLPLALLAMLPLLLPARRHGLRETIEAAMAARGLTLNVRHEIGNARTILDCVAAGLGASVLPLSVAGLAGPDVGWRRLAPAVERRLVLARPRGLPQGQAALGVARLLRQALGQSPQDITDP